MIQRKLRGRMPWAHLPLLATALSLLAADRRVRACLATAGGHIVGPDHGQHRRCRPTPSVAIDPSRRSSGGTIVVDPVGRGEDPPEGGPCGWCRPGPASRGPRPGRGGRAAVRLWAMVLPKPMPGIDPDLLHATLGSRRRDPVGQVGADLVRRRRRSGERPAWSPGRPACAWPPSPPRSRRRPAQSEAETSLTRVAPAATAARATSGLRVSMRHPDVPGQRLDDGEDPTQLLVHRDRIGAGPGAISPPTSSTDAPSASRASPWAMAASGSRKRPPSQNESGVTLSDPHDLGERHEGPCVGASVG